MNEQAQSLDIRHLLTEHAAEVFKTMLSMQIMPLSAGPMPHIGERVTGAVGFGGERVEGALYLHMSSVMAGTAASALLGLPVEELGDQEVNDVVGELTNMLTGHLKSCLCDTGAPCAVSTPAIIRGNSFEIERMHEVRREVLLFDYQANPVVVEVHIKFN
jgi:CheY-specific phosphatase CheX